MSEKRRGKRKGRLRWALQARLRPPRVALDPLLPRSELVSPYVDATGGGITWLHAPTGYGKTLLAGLIFGYLRARKWTCAWLSLDGVPSEPRSLRSHLLAALEAAEIRIRAFQSRELTDPECRTCEDAIVDAIHAEQARVLWVIDGLDALANTVANACLANVLTQVPHNCHVVLSSQRQLQIDLSSHQARGLLAELTPADLRFTESETEELLSGHVDQTRLAGAVRSLEGWPVAVQATRMALQKCPGPNAVSQLLTEGSPTLASYIDLRILGALKDTTKEFLACAAELQTTSGELVDAVRGRSERFQVQRELADFSPLMSMLDDADYSLRAHATIASRLRREPIATDFRRELHARAADLLRGRGDSSGAVRHLVRAGDLSGAVHTLDQVGFSQLLGDLGPAQLTSLFKLLPASALTAAHSRARIAWICTLLNSGRRNEARAEFDRLVAEMRDSASPPAASLLADVKVLDTSFLITGDEFPATDLVDRIVQDPVTVAQAPPEPILWLQQRGAFSQAQRMIEQVAAIVTRHGFRFDAACLETYRGIVAFGRGELDRAIKHYERASELDPGAASGAYSLMIDVPHAELLYQRDRLAEAKELLIRHRTSEETLEDWFDIFVARTTTEVRLLLRSGEVNAALELLRNRMFQARADGLQARAVALLALAVEVRLQAGHDPDEALALAHELPTTLSEFGPDEVLPWRLREIFAMARARCALQQDDPIAARALAAAAAETWDGTGLAPGSIRARLLGCYASIRMGEASRAQDLLLEALERAQKCGNLRILLDEGSTLSSALSGCQKHLTARRDPTLREWVRFLIKRIESEQRHPASAGVFLSNREREVLIGLSVGYTNKMIARQHGIAANTVKHHIRHIYRKLKVRRRVQAAEEARRRALIP